MAVAALIGVLVLSVGAAVTVSPVLRSYFGDSAAYQQSAAELGQSVTKDGWTVTLTDCVGRRPQSLVRPGDRRAGGHSAGCGELLYRLV